MGPPLRRSSTSTKMSGRPQELTKKGSDKVYDYAVHTEKSEHKMINRAVNEVKASKVGKGDQQITLLSGSYAEALTPQFMHYAGQGNVNAVQELLEKGLPVNVRDSDSCETALHRACVYGRLGVVEFLLVMGADPNAIATSGATPLYSAIRFDEPDIVQRLLEYGAEWRPKLHGHATMLSFAEWVTSPDCIAMLSRLAPDTNEEEIGNEISKAEVMDADEYKKNSNRPPMYIRIENNAIASLRYKDDQVTFRLGEEEVEMVISDFPILQMPRFILSRICEHLPYRKAVEFSTLSRGCYKAVKAMVLLNLRGRQRLPPPHRIKIPEISVVDFTGNNDLDDDLLVKFGKAFNKNVKYAKLAGCARLTEYGCIGFMRMCSNLKYININDCNMGKHQFDQFFHVAAASGTIRTIECAGNNFGARGARGFAEAMANPRCVIDQVNMGYNIITEYTTNMSGVEAVGHVLNMNYSLKSLDLRNNRMRAPGVVNLAQALWKNHMVTELDLSGSGVYANKMGDEGAQALADVLTMNRTLRRLNISGNNIGCEGVEALCLSLSVNGQIGWGLESLNLSNNSILGKGAQAVARVIQVNAVLMDIDLRGNPLKNNNNDFAGYRALFIAKQKTHTLSNLRFDEVIGMPIDFDLDEDVVRITETKMQRMQSRNKKESNEGDYGSLMKRISKGMTRRRSSLIRRSSIESLILSGASAADEVEGTSQKLEDARKQFSQQRAASVANITRRLKRRDSTNNIAWPSVLGYSKSRVLYPSMTDIEMDIIRDTVQEAELNAQIKEEEMGRMRDIEAAEALARALEAAGDGQMRSSSRSSKRSHSTATDLSDLAQYRPDSSDEDDDGIAGVSNKRLSDFADALILSAEEALGPEARASFNVVNEEEAIIPLDEDEKLPGPRKVVVSLTANVGKHDGVGLEEEMRRLEEERKVTKRTKARKTRFALDT